MIKLNKLTNIWQLLELNCKEILYIQERRKHIQQICRIENIFVNFFNDKTYLCWNPFAWNSFSYLFNSMCMNFHSLVIIMHL